MINEIFNKEVIDFEKELNSSVMDDLLIKECNKSPKEKKTLRELVISILEKKEDDWKFKKRLEGKNVWEIIKEFSSEKINSFFKSYRTLTEMRIIYRGADNKIYLTEYGKTKLEEMGIYQDD